MYYLCLCSWSRLYCVERFELTFTWNEIFDILSGGPWFEGMVLTMIIRIFVSKTLKLICNTDCCLPLIPPNWEDTCHLQEASVMGMGDMYTLGPWITSESSHAIPSSMLVQILPVLPTDVYYHVELFDSLQLIWLRFTDWHCVFGLYNV